MAHIVPKKHKRMRVIRRTSRADHWLCGYAAALANIIRISGETELAEIAMDSDGLTLGVFAKAGVQKYDTDALRRIR